MEHKQTSDRIESILDSAEKHIRQGGFNAVSFRDIANEVGIKSSSVHYHFPKKEDLGKAVVERYSDNFLKALKAPDNVKEYPVDRIKRLGDAYLNALQSQDSICLGCILGAESAGLPAEVQTAVSGFFIQLLEWTSRALEGANGPSADAGHIISALQGSMILSIALKKPDPLIKTARLLIQSL